MLRRFFLSAATLTALVAPLSAGAAPSNAPSAVIIHQVCAGVPSVITINHGNTNSITFDPAFVQGGGKILPLAFHLQVTAPDGTVVFTDSKVKGNTQNVFAGQTVICTFGGVPDAMGFTFTGTVTVLFKAH
jgi:hypothetical protein